MPGRVYVQPQWIWDCVNEGKVLATNIYAPGETLPPHLSPWIKPTSGQYDPRATLEEQEPEGEADDAIANELEDELEDEDEDEEEEEADLPEVEEDIEDGDEVDAGGMDVAGTDDESEQDEEDEEGKAFAGFDDAASEASEPDDEALHQMELEAEATGVPVKSQTNGNNKISKATKSRQSERAKKDEEIERQKMMMSNKKRKLFEKMQYSNSKKDVEAEKLRNKRRKLEKSARQ